MTAKRILAGCWGRGWVAFMAAILVPQSAVLAAGLPRDTAGELTVSARDAMVTDTQSKLVWERCVAGMNWTGGTCKGIPLRMTHGEAQAWAAARAKAEGIPWRLPRVNELQHLRIRLNQGRRGAAEFFPAAPDAWYWTSTASLNTARVNPYDYDNVQRGHSSANVSRLGANQAWAVHFDSGDARGDAAKRSRLVVRLVRGHR